MRPAWLVLLAALGTAPAGAALPPAVPGALTLTFTLLDGLGVGGADTVLDVGQVAATGDGRQAPRIVIRRRVTLRIDGPGASARLSVMLASDLPGTLIRVDGVPVTSVPRLIAPAHRIGAAVVHEIELTIPAGVAPGAFASDLRWQAETN